MPEKIMIKGYNCFVDFEEPIQTLDVQLNVKICANEFAAFQERFLKELQTFLDERK